jgi:hypothetical protein
MTRLPALERRLRELEDRAGIFWLIASSGPSVDRGQGLPVGRRRADDTDIHLMTGSAAVAAMAAEDPYQQYIRNGSAHVQSISAIDGTWRWLPSTTPFSSCTPGDSLRIGPRERQMVGVRAQCGWMAVQRRLTASGQGRLRLESYGRHNRQRP